ncbi:MAG: MacB-like periplasmic core domain containing protein, partial [Anaerospora sp.]|nr:MacB-like periplasmic core domain containing protein [Anaerospora sp.]
EQVLKTAAYIVIILGLTIMALSLYWSSLSRTRDRAILRALGAGSRDIFIIILTEAALLTGLGVIIGGLSGFGLYALLAKMLILKTALLLPLAFTVTSGYIMLTGLLLGVAAGSIPAAFASREDVVQYL